MRLTTQTASARIAAIGLGALVGVAVISGQAPVQPTQAPATGLIIGQIVDADSHPVSDAIVTLSGGPGPQAASPIAAMAAARKIIADSRGQFVFRDVAKGRYTLTATKPGHVAGNYGKIVPRGPGTALELADGERLIDVRITVWKYAVITGRVIDEMGEPVVAATIIVKQATSVSGRPGFSNISGATTDDRGIYRVASLSPGNYIVGIPATSTTIPAAMIEEYFRASGDARATMQQAILAAAPSVSSPGSAGNMQIGDHILQVQGRMPTPPVPANDGTQAVYPAVFHPQATRLADASVITVKSGETRVGVDLQLRAVPSVRVSGQLEGPADAIGITTLYLMSLNGGEPLGSVTDAAATTVSDAGGAFTFLGVPSGQYSLFAMKWPSASAAPAQMTVIQTPGGTAARGASDSFVSVENPTYWALHTLTVAGTGSDGVRVAMRAGVRLSGKVIFEGASPPPARQFQALLEATIPWMRTLQLGEAPLGADGTFVLPAVPAGRYVLTVPTPNGWFVKSAVAKGKDLVELPFDLTEDLTDIVITVSNRGARIAGSVRDRDAKPDAGAGVLAFPADPRQWVDFSAYPRRLRETRTARDGSFSLGDLPAGDYFLVAASSASFDWSAPRFFERFSQVATRVTLTDGEQRTIELRTVQVR